MPHLLLLCLLVGSLCPLVFSQPPPCALDDYEYSYTQCSPIRNNTRDLVYYLKPFVNCSGGVPPPPTIYGLPCFTSCAPGSFLGLGQTNCSACPYGTFSIGGGYREYTWFEWPSYFLINRYWFPNNPFRPPNTPNATESTLQWTLEGNNIKSGNVTDYQSSVLTITVYIVSNTGHVTFNYRVNAEPDYDGLIFYVDAAIVLAKTSFTPSFTTFTTRLTAGVHVLKWEYYKDVSRSLFEDAAFISMIEVGGLYYSDEQCEPCPEGTYNSNNGSTICVPCPANTYADTSGTITCHPCDSNMYSFSEAAECIPRPACTPLDYEQVYTACNTAGTRTLQSFWLNPIICDTSNYPLPDPVTDLPCGLCTDGEIRNPTTHQCEFCPNGQYSAGGAPCQSCPVGSAAVKVLSIDEFNDWPAGSTTNCTGDCAGPGWVLHNTYMDSGLGHGNMVQSWFALNTTLVTAGTVSFAANISCPSEMCSLTYTSTAGDNYVLTTSRSPSYALPAGTWTLKWTFSKYGFTNNRNDTAAISSIFITGVAAGGAINCTTCPDGSIPSSDKSFCAPCPAGQHSDPTHTSCVQCPAGTHSPTNGSSCIPCGAGTVPTPDFTGCIVNCTYSPDGVILYDLSPLKSSKSYGPIIAVNDTVGIQKYYINLCTKMSTPCLRTAHTNISSYVCQVTQGKIPNTNEYEGKDLGAVLGWAPLPQNSSSYPAGPGVLMKLGYGDVCTGTRPDGTPIVRDSYIAFVCDPLAGIGSPGPDGVVEDHNDKCEYFFIWKSLYACPVCHPDVDMWYYYSPCQNGVRVKTYYWLLPVPMCHGGSLPPPETVNCTETAGSCPAGQYLLPGADCTPCPPGSFSVGGGEQIMTWAPVGGDLPQRFSSQCVEGSTCTKWEGGEDGTESVSSGVGNSSLSAPFDFVVDGSISFSYKIYSTNTNEHFSFTINGVSQIAIKAGVSRLGWVHVSFPLKKGSYFFVWSFMNGFPGTASVPRAGAAIKALILQGTDYHDDTCTPCPPAFHSPANSSVCNGCPVNTYTNRQDSSKCTACPAGTHSLARSTYCTPNPTCTPSDYTFEYSECFENGTRLKTPVYLQPFVCNQVDPLPPATTEPCPICLPGYYPTSTAGACWPCTNGQYFDGVQCSEVPTGSRLVRKRTYFVDGEVTWPQGFTTSCSGDCGNAGWRILGDGVDSGYHAYNGVDSILRLTTNVTEYGTLSFSYTIESLSSALDFYIDNVFVASYLQASGDVSMPIAAGSQVFTWNYHQHNGTTGKVSLFNVVVEGSLDPLSSTEITACPRGTSNPVPGADTCTPCTPGYYSPDDGATSCTPCPEMSYNAEHGATECRICGEGTFTNHTGATYCPTRSCKYLFLGSNDKQVEFSLASTDIIGPIRVVTPTNSLSFFFNFCNSSLDITPCATGSPTHACAIENGKARNWGPDFKWVARQEQIQAGSPNTTFQIYMEHGEATNCPSEEHRSLLFNFECDASKGINTPTYQPQLSSICNFVFNWPSIMGCQVCDPDADYNTVQGQCVDGMRTQQRARNKVCNGPQIYSEPSQSCSGTVEFPIAVVFVVIGVILVLIVVAVIVFVKNRRIVAQYSRLKEQTATSLDTTTDANL